MLAAVVVGVSVVVVLLGALSDRGGRVDGRDGSGGSVGAVTVTGAPGAVSGTPAPSPAASSGPSGPVVVHVVGAVRRPGVVALGTGSRVSAAIDRAGGASDDADLARLNLARVVVDGERLYVPKAGETEIPTALDAQRGTGGTGASGGAAGGGADAVVDLNAADQSTLETLPGIGPSLAGRILAWRDEHGRFSTVEDLLDVNGIGDGRFADLRDRVRV